MTEKKVRTKEDAARRRRLIGYPVFLAMLAGLIYGGWFYVPHLGFDEDRTDLLGLIGAKDWEACVELLDEMRKRYPKDVRVPLLRAYMEECRGDLEAAKELYRSSVAMAYNDRQRQELLVTVADIDRRQGDVGAAEKQLADAVKQYGESYRSHHLRALILIDKHALDEALGEVAKMDEENPVNPHARSLRMRIQRLQEASASRTEQAVTGN